MSPCSSCSRIIAGRAGRSTALERPKTAEVEEPQPRSAACRPRQHDSAGARLRHWTLLRAADWPAASAAPVEPALRAGSVFRTSSLGHKVLYPPTVELALRAGSRAASGSRLVAAALLDAFNYCVGRQTSRGRGRAADPLIFTSRDHCRQPCLRREKHGGQLPCVAPRYARTSWPTTRGRAEMR